MPEHSRQCTVAPRLTSSKCTVDSRQWLRAMQVASVQCTVGSSSALLPQAILVILASCQAHQPVILAEAERSEAKWPESVAVFAIFESKVSLKMDVGLPFSSSISAQIPATAGFSRKSFGRNDGWSRKQRGAFCNLSSAFLYPRPQIVFLDEKLPGWAVFFGWEAARSYCLLFSAYL